MGCHSVWQLQLATLINFKGNGERENEDGPAGGGQAVGDCGGQEESSPDLHTAEDADESAGQLDELPPEQGEKDEDLEGEHGSAGSREAAEEAAGGEEDCDGGDDEGETGGDMA